MRSSVRAQLRPREGLRVSIRALVAGIIACAALAMIAAAILGLVMYRTLLPEAMLPNIMGAVNLVALICGGYFAGRAAETTGWLNGGLAGLLYTCLLLALGMFFFPGPTGVWMVARRVALGFGLGALGGTVGVNT
jgi:putative membrane protein (TIGR04086 family)